MYLVPASSQELLVDCEQGIVTEEGVWDQMKRSRGKKEETALFPCRGKRQKAHRRLTYHSS